MGPFSPSALRARYLLRKSPETLRAQAERTKLARTLGAWDLTALGVGAIIGAGIFTLTGIVTAQKAGPAVAVSFVIAAVVSGVAGLAYAELSAMMPLGGSAYTYAYATFGELPAWILGWALVLEYAIGNTAVASGFSGNVSSLLDAAGFRLPDALRAAPPAGAFDLPAFLVVAMVTVLLLRPVRESARANLALVVAKVAILLVFLAVALPTVKTAYLSPFAPFGAVGILSGAALIFFSFIGFDAVSTAAEETRNPQRDLPLGILGSLAVCTLLYVLIGLALTGNVPYAKLDVRDPLATALGATGHPGLGALMNVGGILATLSVLLVFQLGSTRIFFALARDGLIPAWFTRVSPRFRTPTRITVATGLVVALGAAVLPLAFLVQLTNIGTLFAFAMVLGAVPILRRTHPHLPRPFRVPLSPALPLVGVALCLGLAYFLGSITFLGFLGWLGLGLMIYAAYGAHRSVLRTGEAPDVPE